MILLNEWEGRDLSVRYGEDDYNRMSKVYIKNMHKNISDKYI